jgi:hypothetical protein
MIAWTLILAGLAALLIARYTAAEPRIAPTQSQNIARTSFELYP